MRGNLDSSIRDFHEQYGEVVRYSPDELSFASEEAWKDIYHQKHPLEKDPAFYSFTKLGRDGAQSIFSAKDAAHARIRKAMSHAFSEKALREQEPFLKQYVDLLVEKLRGVAASKSSVDMVEWYNYTTFDIIGDLAIGRSFGCLNDSKYHSWVHGIVNLFKLGPIIKTVHIYHLAPLLRLLAPKKLRDNRQRHEQYVVENVQERLSKGFLRDRPDFLSYILRSKGTPEELNDHEIEANANFLLLAGSETTGTALAGTTYYLLKTPEAFTIVVEEVRKAFETEDEINFLNCAERLPYMQACLQEGLRIYPPGPVAAPRKTPRDKVTIIGGYEIPAWTGVGVHALSASHSPSNFYLPRSFLPERWLPPAQNDPGSPFRNDKRGASQPFSLGPRNCLGKSFAYNEMRVILARLLWNFDLSMEPESDGWDKQKTYVLWEKGPLMCKLTDIRSD
ncbi:hypothetical protein VTL71DRAFT_3021 [Oculimacula yallundae]|uniref:Cytochrome P450 n=1 Tax=Oculimacula yallundae TaxID=86028 RepID=A0ABR4C5Z1_9HELO